MDEGQTNNPNVTPSGYPMKLWGLLAIVAPIAHITQNGIPWLARLPKQSFFIGHNADINISVPI